MHTIT